MPRIFDNIKTSLLPYLKESIKESYRGDFCIGYFNLRGWRELADEVDQYSGLEGNCARVLVGMHQTPQEELRKSYLFDENQLLDNQSILRLKKKLAREFRTN